MCASDSLELILSLLAPRVANVIADGRNLEYLDCLLEFLAAWDKRPDFLTGIVYRWCSTLFEVAGGAGGRTKTPTESLHPSKYFHKVGFRYDGFRSGDTSDYPFARPPVRKDCMDRLFRILAIGFRQVGPNHCRPVLRLNHTSQSDRMFEAVFSSDDDETIADAVCIWIVDGVGISPGSFARYLARRVEKTEPLSPRLRWAGIRVIEHIGHSELQASGLETICLLNRLEADMDEIVYKSTWAMVLISAIRSPPGMESLSSHCWCLLGKLVKSVTVLPRGFALRDVEVMRSLKEAGDWETLEVWMVVIWQGELVFESVEDVEWATLKLLLRRPSALPMFEEMHKGSKLLHPYQEPLQQICDKARAESLHSECSPQQ